MATFPEATTADSFRPESLQIGESLQVGGMPQRRIFVFGGGEHVQFFTLQDKPLVTTAKRLLQYGQCGGKTLSTLQLNPRFSLLADFPLGLIDLTAASFVDDPPTAFPLTFTFSAH